MTNTGIVPDEWVLSYAAGSLSEAHALVLASHIEYHPELQKKLADAEAIGGSLLNDNEPVQVSDDLWDNLMGHIDDEVQDEDENPVSVSNLPDSLARYIGGGLDQLKWRTMGPGLSQVRLWTGPNDERLWLLKAKGGAKVPPHDHNGLEMTLVLQGSYIADGERYGAGQMEIADDDTKNHCPQIEEGEDCICLVVTEAPIKLHSLIGRMVQPFIGL